mgnify:CR=1 FL=1
MIDLPEPPWGIATTPGAVWSAGGEQGAIHRLDVSTGQLAEVTRAQRPFLLAAGSDHLWVSDNQAGSLLRIDLADHAVLTTPVIGEGPWGIAIDHEAVWFSDHPGDRIGRIDPTTGALLAEATTDGWPSAMALAFGSLWVACWRDGTICAHDPVTGELRSRLSVSAGPGVHGVAVTTDRLWVTHVEEGLVYPVDPVGPSVGPAVRVGASPWCSIAHGGIVWVACTDAASIWAIGATTGSVACPIETPTSPYGLAGAADGLWAGIRRPPALLHLPWT